MSYEIALNKAWDDLIQLKAKGEFTPPLVKPRSLERGAGFTLKFLADEYSIDLENHKVLSLACNVLAKDFTVILVLHYLAQKIKGLPGLTGEWLPFRELAGIEGYYPAFRSRAIEPIIRKYGNNPEAFFGVLERFSGKKAERGDAGLILDAFEKVPVLISLWRKDEEFGPDANIFFDKSIINIFCIEDIVVLAGIIATSI